MLQFAASLGTLAAFVEGPRAFGFLALLGQLCLWALGFYLRESSYDLVAANLALCGVLVGAAGLSRRTRILAETPPPRTFAWQDAGIFVVTVAVVAAVSRHVFGGFIFNGDEVANSYQANVYGHLRAYGPIPPCAPMFENYWVFRWEGRAFSQYTPGWPLFMAPFERAGVIWLAGPTMAGIVSVAVARLSRRVAWGLGGTTEQAARVMWLAGPIGSACAILGPSMLLNGASRFAHTMVCACFAWSVESVCAASEPSISRRRAWGYGLLLGASTSLGLATRPADGGLLGVGVFLYFLWAVAKRRLSTRAFSGTVVAFAFFGGLTAIILRLQVGRWFHTGYWVTPNFHPEGALTLSLPQPHLAKLAVPLATGSYMWWPAAVALGLAGLVQAARGRERRVVLVLGTSAVALTTFYFFVEFGRYAYDGLGPRYVLPVVVALAPGSAAILAPIVARLAVAFARGTPLRARFRSAFPAVLASTAFVFGIVHLAPMIYPIAQVENRGATAALRAAKNLKLKNAIVILEPEKTTAHWSNLTQNPPLDPNPDVLFLARRTDADEACARQHFPGRSWYRAHMGEVLTPY